VEPDLDGAAHFDVRYSRAFGDAYDGLVAALALAPR
jgi:hypothetical protein